MEYAHMTIEGKETDIDVVVSYQVIKGAPMSITGSGYGDADPAYPDEYIVMDIELEEDCIEEEIQEFNQMPYEDMEAQALEWLEEKV